MILSRFQPSIAQHSRSSGRDTVPGFPFAAQTGVRKTFALPQPRPEVVGVVGTAQPMAMQRGLLTNNYVTPSMNRANLPRAGWSH